ncbi:hypothetical protein M422DRAFT_24875 [Sphaerobolus stellatus SS14]|nr:hypothetical protein M422DRAFT_24875 [Sphaerobolus stellatus SS14]
MILNIITLVFASLLWPFIGARPIPELHAEEQALLYACNNSITADSNLYTLQETSTFDQYVQCVYYHYEGGKSLNTQYCRYDCSNLTLYHYPGIPQSVDSISACPDTLPLVQT